MQRFIAKFDPQAWVNDYAMSVDPQGPQEWDVTDFVLRRKQLKQKIEEAVESLGWWLDDHDIFQDHPDAPQWVRDWQGPFTITVEIK
jgi:hypothetical protein